MEAEGILTALAEVAIAIAGFSGIVVALKRRGEAWSESDKTRFSVLLQISLSCVFWSFTPIVLYLVNTSAVSVWGWSTGIWLMFVLGGIAYRLPRIRRATSLDAEPPARVVMALMIGVLVISVAAQVANVGWLRTSWPHVLAILLSLLLSSILFVRLLRRVIGPAAY
jgi:hypothetical protein